MLQCFNDLFPKESPHFQHFVAETQYRLHKTIIATEFEFQRSEKACENEAKKEDFE